MNEPMIMLEPTVAAAARRFSNVEQQRAREVVAVAPGAAIEPPLLTARRRLRPARFQA